MMSVQSFVNTPVSSNCYVLYDKEHGNDCIIVDPGTKDNQELVAFLSKEVLTPKYIILTHEHFDHCWGVNALVELYHIPIVCSSLCAEAIKDRKRNCSVFYDNVGFTIYHETISVESLEDHLQFLDDEIKFYHTPGHTDASICVVVDNYLFTGDTLIKDEKTVTKLPTGSIVKLKESFRMFDTLKGCGYKVYSGHGVCFLLDEYLITKSNLI